MTRKMEDIAKDIRVVRKKKKEAFEESNRVQKIANKARDDHALLCVEHENLLKELRSAGSDYDEDEEQPAHITIS